MTVKTNLILLIRLRPLYFFGKSESALRVKRMVEWEVLYIF